MTLRSGVDGDRGYRIDAGKASNTAPLFGDRGILQSLERDGVCRVWVGAPR